MRRGLCCLALGFAFGAVPLAAWTAPDPATAPKPDTRFEDAIDVSLLTMVVRVVDSWGNPILGLQPADFRVRVDKRDVPIVSLDWISGTEPPASADEATAEDPQAPPGMHTDRAAGPTAERGDEPSADRTATPPAERATAPSAGRLIVVFVQTDFNSSRISGHMRLRPHTRELLGTLHPSDRVAVVSYDSHLKLWQDFTHDVEATIDAIDTGVLFSHERPVDPAEPVSLARHFDHAAARDAASPERALELLGRALEPLPGEKTILFLGWGLGRYARDGVHMTAGFKPAVRALYDAQASVFVLDVSSADWHSLEVGLQEVAAVTGGAYYRTFRLPSLATRALARAISGYYVLTLDGATVGDKRGRVDVDLRGKRARRGIVLARPVAVATPAS